MKSIYYKFPFVDVPNSLKPFVGKSDPGTRMYRAEGSDKEMVVWFDKLHDHFDRLVSPGGVSMFVPASRAAVYNRIEEGRLTLFLFHVVKVRRTWLGRKSYMRSSPYGYIPVSECKAWAEELEQKADSRAKELVTEEEFQKSEGKIMKGKTRRGRFERR